MGRRIRVTVAFAIAGILTAGFGAGSVWAAGPTPGTPEYVQRDNQNMADAYGRQTAPDGQLNPSYVSALPGATNPGYLQQIAQQAATLEPPTLRSIDAIHLATALSVDDLSHFVTYDARLAEAAARAGLVVAMPGAR